jgi:hypothetical protein
MGPISQQADPFFDRPDFLLGGPHPHHDQHDANPSMRRRGMIPARGKPRNLMPWFELTMRDGALYTTRF